jgi:uncharacterized protein (DUF1800 family)
MTRRRRRCAATKVLGWFLAALTTCAAVIEVRAAAPVLTSAVSRRTHTGVGDFDVTLPLVATSTGAGIECRQLTGLRIVLTFDQPIMAASSTYTLTNDATNSTTGLTANNPVYTGNTLTLNVSGMADATTYRVTVTNIAAADNSGTLASAVVFFRTLLGDANGNGQVTVADIAMIKANNGQALTLFNFRSDLNCNGAITVADTAQVKARSGGSVIGGATTNTPPTIGTIPDQTATADQASTPVGFAVGDAETPAAALAVKATSSDQNLLPDANITLGGSGASRTISVTPNPNVSGSCQVTVTVTDGLASTSTVFNVSSTPAATLYIAILTPEHGHPSSGTGTATLQVNAAGTQAVLRFQYGNLTSPKVAEHLHHGSPGVDGPIIYDIDNPAPPSPPTQQADGSYLWIFDPNGTPTPADIVSEIAAGNYYMNVHTANYPDGEIRGQFNLAQGSQTFTPPPYVAPPAETPRTLSDTARFLQQATFGARLSDINAIVNSVSSTPLTDWITAQMAIPATHIYGDGYGGMVLTTVAGANSGTILSNGQSAVSIPVGSTIYDPTGTIPAGTTVTGTPGTVIMFSQNATATVAGSVNGSGTITGGVTVSFLPAVQRPFTFKARQNLEAGSSSPDRVVESFFGEALNGRDQLRQRVAFAYSQIFVVSSVDDGVNGQPGGLATYHDLLADDAFVNFRQLLKDVTLHPIMGQYLNMRGNVKQTLPAKPNENYAREVMQLFSIGLNLRHPDGTLKLDANALPIACYDQTVIEGFAQVFTGWDLNTTTPRDAGDVFAMLNSGTPNFLSLNNNDYHRPMKVTAGNHSVYQKDLLSYTGNYNPGSPDRYSIPASASQTTTTANAELDQGLDNIFNHPNCGPFICRELIQRLIGSTPSPAYLFRVAQVFANDQYNGSNPTDASGNPTAPIGVRGNMAAVIQTILLDSEARSTTMLGNPGYGHLREPVLRLTEGIRATHATSGSNYFKVSPTDGSLLQAPYRAPTVFNFYTPDYSDPGAVAAAGLASPELYIANENTNVTYINTVYGGIYNSNGWPGGDLTTHLDALDPLVIANAGTFNGNSQINIDPGTAASLVVGEPVSGPGIAAGTTIVAISNAGTSLTLSQPATADGAGVSLTFGFVAATTTVNFTATFTSATVTSNVGLVAGQTLSCPNVSPGTYITSVSGNTIIFSKAALSNGTGVSTTFGYGGNIQGIQSEAALAGVAVPTSPPASPSPTIAGQSLLERLNMELMGGEMPAAMWTRIATYVNTLPTGSAANNLARARAAANLILSSAQYCAEK